MRRCSWALLIGAVLLALVYPVGASASRRRPSQAGPFVALRDANGRPLLAWGADGLVRRAGELGYQVVVLTARSIQHRSLVIPGVRIVRGCGYRDRGSPTAVRYAAAQVRRCAARMAEEVRRGVPVLVTCAMGENRSAFMAARIRHLVTGEPGTSLVDQMRNPAPGHRSFVNRAFRRVARRWHAASPVPAPTRTIPTESTTPAPEDRAGVE
ncbi:MAG: hypothetical protein IT379_01770 [Deltaproteobacteria bacterium]|nr:hypothetical protein [Deltaproteobacteria bacterium]